MALLSSVSLEKEGQLSVLSSPFRSENSENDIKKTQPNHDRWIKHQKDWKPWWKYQKITMKTPQNHYDENTRKPNVKTPENKQENTRKPPQKKIENH